jgi:acetyltransferase
VKFTLDRAALRRRFESLVPPEGDTLTEGASKALLEAYGIPVATVHEARTADEAVRIAATLGGPVVLKILSPDITHKTDVGEWRSTCVTKCRRAAFARIVSAARGRPEARIDGGACSRWSRVRTASSSSLG